MLILGHRGASADAPENTREAFQEAFRQGADGVELDVMRCGSGEVVVCHDEKLDRLAGLDWHVKQTPWWKLQTLDVGTHLGHAPARIPKLDEVLDLVPPGKLVNVELKAEGFDEGGLVEATLDVLRQAKGRVEVIVSSFNPFCLIRMARRDSAIRRGYLIDPDRAFWVQAGLWPPLTANHSVHAPFQRCSRTSVAWWRRFHFETAAWTVDDPSEARRLETLGVTYCITNRPGALRQGLSPPHQGDA